MGPRASPTVILLSRSEHRKLVGSSNNASKSGRPFALLFYKLGQEGCLSLTSSGFKSLDEREKERKGLATKEEKEPEPGLSVPVYAIPAHLCLSLFFSGE
jgi:hypothetical protein